MLDYQRQMVTVDTLLANQSQAEEQMQFQNQNFDANEQSVSILLNIAVYTERKNEATEACEG